MHTTHVCEANSSIAPHAPNKQLIELLVIQMDENTQNPEVGRSEKFLFFCSWLDLKMKKMFE